MTEEARRGKVLYEPSPEQIEQSNLSGFCRSLQGESSLLLAEKNPTDRYQALHAWSVQEPEQFWQAVAAYFDVIWHQSPAETLSRRSMPGAEWFAGGMLNYAEHALRPGGGTAVIALDEGGERRELSRTELRDAVARCRQGLKQLGVGRGDCVAAILPNGLEALIAFLATASLGAVWSSCPPEFGTQSVLDRFQQIKPKILFATRGYHYGGKWFEKKQEVSQLATQLISVGHLVWVDSARAPEPPTTATVLEPDRALLHLNYDALLSTEAELVFEPVAFGQPLWILYSSGTTGTPKAIVHSHGGILLEHFKVLALHTDLKQGDRFFWFSTTGWMMWNYLVSGLLVGATVVLYDGSPNFPDLSALWRLAERERLSYFGASAPFLMACRNARLSLLNYDWSALRGVGSTGAPLPAEGFDWVYENLGDQVLLGSVSGGTDLCTAFVLSCPWLPVRAGELQCAALGADVQAFSPDGRPLVGEVGELVILTPMPSMPLYFVGDSNGTRYRESYFQEYPGVWRHGDWILRHPDGACVIYGRSDATLNRGGVRMGTSDFYRVVEQLPEIVDSLVVDTSQLGQEGKLWLFVVLAPGLRQEGSHQLPEALLLKIRALLRSELSPRHVPEVIWAVSEIPYTLSGKKLEVPVKRLLQGEELGRVSNLDTLRNPRSLLAIRELART